MMTRIRASCAFGTLGLVAGFWMLPEERSELQADPVLLSQDTDGDFLPDVVEWVCVSNANAADTDGDGIGDFVEVVQRSQPHLAGPALPSDHELRLVLTSLTNSAGVTNTYVHLLMRFMTQLDALNELDAWVELQTSPPIRISLNPLAPTAVVSRQLTVPGEGIFVHLAFPLAPQAVLEPVMPFTVGAAARVGSRALRTVVPIFSDRGEPKTLVGYDDQRVMVQTLNATSFVSPSTGAGTSAGSGVSANNRCCVMSLRSVGTSPAGTVLEVVDAECVDFNDLVCPLACPDSKGTTFTVPGGVGSITGG